MLYKTKLGLPSQYIVKTDFSKGDLFVLHSVHLKETEIPGGEGEPDSIQYEIDIWYLGEYKSEEGTLPLGVTCEDVLEDAEIKYFILFRMPEFYCINKL